MTLPVEGTLDRDNGGKLEVCRSAVGAKIPGAAFRDLNADGSLRAMIGIRSEDIPRVVAWLTEAWRRTGGAWRSDDPYSRCFRRENGK